MKQRVVALLLLAGVVTAVAFDRARPHVVSTRTSIAAPSHALELPPAIERARIVVAPRIESIPIATPTRLVGTVRAASIYLRNRSLLL